MRLLWPSFLVAAIATAVIFAFIAPENVVLLDGRIEVPSIAIYSVGFFVLWAVSALSSALTIYTLPDHSVGEDDENSDLV